MKIKNVKNVVIGKKDNDKLLDIYYKINYKFIILKSDFRDPSVQITQIRDPSVQHFVFYNQMKHFNWSI